MAVCLAAAALAPARAALKYDSNTDAYGGTLLTPTKGTLDKRDFYFEIPHDPVGVLFMAHGCVHDAADFWPSSAACPECSGALPTGAVGGRVGGGLAPPSWAAAVLSGVHTAPPLQLRRGPHCRHRCAGLPEEVSHTKQALARGYAVIAVDSKDRRWDSRCYS